jgi:multimeric flavodoxin WrbA
MRILVLNGIPKDEKYSAYEQAIEKSVIENTSHKIEYFRLRDMDIKYCTGCWSCWLKTPGLCSIKDDYEQIFSRIPNTDKILYISPVILGYESSLIKKCKDRSIGTSIPYITFYKGEQHHLQRYEKNPDVSVLLITDDDTIQEDIDLIKSTYFRNALNLRKEDISHFNTINNVGGVTDVFNRL